jgi:hypothetical protein
MKLYSIGLRSYIVDPKKVIKGGVYRKEDFQKQWMYIEPKAKFEVQDAYGKQLMGMYPNQFMELDGEGKASFEPEAKKTRVKKAKNRVAKPKAKPSRKMVMA